MVQYSEDSHKTLIIIKKTALIVQKDCIYYPV